MNRINELRHERKGIHDQMIALNKKAQDEKRSLSDDEAIQWDRMKADLEKKKEEIDRLEFLQEEQRTLAEQHIETAEPKKKAEQRTHRQQYDDAFTRYLATGESGLTTEQRSILRSYKTSEERVQVTNVAADGGYLVKETYAENVIHAMKAYSGIMQACHINRTPTGGPFNVIFNDDTNNMGEVLGEAQTVTQDKLTFTKKVMNAWKYSSKAIKISLEEIQDNAYGLEGMVAAKQAERLGRIGNLHMVKGTGTNQIEGIETGATNSNVTIAAGAITRAKLIDLITSLDPAYVRRMTGSPAAPADPVGNRDYGSAFTFTNTTLGALQKLEIGSADSRPIWSLSMRDGEPDRILGYPYFLTHQMDELTTASGKPIIFGDFKQYHLRIVRDMTLLVAKERYIDDGVYGYFSYMRMDGKVMDGKALKYITVA